MEADLSQLLAQVALGSRPAFGKLYERASAKLFGVLLRILRDRQEAEDALQEVFIKVWHNAARFQQEGAKPMAWLIAIARNHAIDRLRGRRAPAVEISEAFEVADEAPGPEARALQGDDKSRLESCLEKLEPKKAEAVRAAYVEGYSYLELAGRFGLPLNTLRTWLRRSLLSLKECLDQ